MGLLDWLTSSSPGGIAGTVASSIISETINGVDKIIQDFKLPPEQKILWEQFKLDQVTKLQAVAAADTASARQREMTVHDWTPSILAWTIIIIFGGSNYYVFTHTLPTGNEMLIARVLGTLDMAVGLVLGYYYGSSASSRSKDITIHNMATQEKSQA